MEVGGYAARIASHKNPFVVATFVAQYFLIVVVSTPTSLLLYVPADLLPRPLFSSPPRSTSHSRSPSRGSPVATRSSYSVRNSSWPVSWTLRRNLFLVNLTPAVFITADVVTSKSMSLIKAISNSADALTLAIIQVVGAALIGVAESDRVSGDGDSPVTPKQANDILLSGLVVQVGQGTLSNDFA